MGFQDFCNDFAISVNVTAESDKENTTVAFINTMTEYLLENNIIPDFEHAFYKGTGRHNRKIRVDAYAFDDLDKTMYLFIANYQMSVCSENLTLTQTKTLLDQLYNFLEESVTGQLHRTIEISGPTHDLIDTLRRGQKEIRKYSLFLLTNCGTSKRIEKIEESQFKGALVEYHVWGINRLFQLSESAGESNEVVVDLTDYLYGGLPCLEASSTETEEYKSYLCVLPGKLLADIFDQYGSRLLEGNVRSFLSTKRAVNRKIRETILRLPSRFFAYNNGISATATSVEISLETGITRITKIRGLQIVNGGQTTASISTARFKDRADLSQIYVQMKLTEVQPKLAAEIIPMISRSSNSQNKVSEADFFSNHPFHIYMEKSSRKIYAPATNGAQYETRWFYERANGQFLQAQAKLTSSEKKRFLLINPQKQKVTKTDLAKAINTWRHLPYTVSLGAQKNFSIFADWVSSEWNENPLKFNDHFYKFSISSVLLFRYASACIKKQIWYENGYLANITTYSLAKLSLMLQEHFLGNEFDFLCIWNKQSIPAEIAAQLEPIYYEVFKILTDEDRPTQNVTEWAKNKACWEKMCNIKIPFNISLKKYMIDKKEAFKFTS